uniref:protein FAM163A-like n=1 Tax=Doryrhamphus excisus TaxID=161450 RepID=UPI0025AEBB53|nr:protein FAM163A-like [Doryrhamphus excisus]XP_057946086.1 protein FAM163A-like [Doryrhamphus excisus]
MSAGTIVIAGGILAGVILLCIIAVLCYCRLQYYCCKKNDSEADASSAPQPDPLSHFPCNTCNALANDGAAITPVSLDQLDAVASTSHHSNACRACSPYTRRAALPSPEMLNGGERLGFHTYYENPAVSLPQGSTPTLSYYSGANVFPPPPRPYSTQV